AAIGLVQLSKLDEMQQKRRRLVWRYLSNLREYHNVLALPDWSNEHSWHLFVVRTPLRNELSTHLRNNGIATGVHYRPLHLYKCYGPQPELPVAEKVWPTLLTLPLYPDLKLEEVDEICGHIKDFFAAHNQERLGV